MSITSSIKRLLYRRLSLSGYLRTVSAGFFIGLRLGLGKRSAAYEYPRFLKNLVRKGDIVLDIGANLGYYSRIVSRLVGEGGKVYAVEPVRPILGVLRHNLRRCHNVEIVPYALGSEDKPISMVNDSSLYTGYMGTGQNYIPENDDEGEGGCASPQSRSSRAEAQVATSANSEPCVSTASTLFSSRSGRMERGVSGAAIPPEVSASDGNSGNIELPPSQDASTAYGDVRRSVDEARSIAARFEAEMRRGSELFAHLERLDFIKCDIEGYEAVVIPEMAPVIEKHLPVVLLETGGANRRPMIELLRGWGYAGYVLQNGKLTSVMRAPNKDIVFIPGHRHEGLKHLIAQ